MGKLTRFFPARLTLRKWRFSRYCLFVKLNVIFRHIYIADGDPTEEQLRLLLEEVSEAELPGHHHRLAETKQRHPGGRGQPRREARGVLEAARHRGGQEAVEIGGIRNGDLRLGELKRGNEEPRVGRAMSMVGLTIDCGGVELSGIGQASGEL